jgi:hypothetical protein
LKGKYREKLVQTSHRRERHDTRNRSIEEGNYKSADDIVGNQHCTVIILRIAFSFDVPIFNGTNYVALVTRTKLDLDFITTLFLRVLQE